MVCNYNIQITKIFPLLFLFPLLLATTKGCERFEQKSQQLIPVQRLENTGWTMHWVTRYESPVLYTYAICNNVTLEIGKHLEIEGGNANLKYILFRNSTLQTIPVGVFTFFTSLTELFLNNSGIEIMHPGAFSGLAKLEALFLQENRIEALERGTLNYLTHLKTLDLSRNRLKMIEENSLLGLLNLNEIRLDHNVLDQPHFAPFQSTKSLKVVHLSNNSLESLLDKTFSNLDQLEIVLMDNNELTNLTEKIFENSSKIDTVDVSFNNLSVVDFSVLPNDLLLINLSWNKINLTKNWSELKGIVEIDLSHNEIAVLEEMGTGITFLKLSWNKIEALTQFSLRNCGMLLELDLGHNLIASIQEDSLGNLTELQMLKLNDNRLVSLPFGCFQNMKSLNALDLSENLLVDLGFGTFNGLNSLETLSIARNRITIIHENSFHVLGNLRELFLNDNALSSLKIKDVLEHMNRLEFVDLNGNDWDCNALFVTIKMLRERSVSVPHGDKYKTANIFGIPCRNRGSSLDSEISTKALDESNPIPVKSSTVVDSSNSSFFKIFDSNFNESGLYKFLADYRNLSFHAFLNESFMNSQFVRYFNHAFYNSSFFRFFAKYPEEETKNGALIINPNSVPRTELIEALQEFSSRVTGFIAIMTTILLVIILLFVLLFVKPRPKNHFYCTRDETVLNNDGFELR